MLDSQQVEMVVGDGREGYPDEGPYDAIHVGASAPHLPQALGMTLNLVRYRRSVLWIRIHFNANPDPTFLVNADPDPGFS
jgi:hypothetical protein